jgi:hypothetical protein
MEIEWRFTPSLVAGEEIAKQFGRRLAEKPILDNMRGDSDLGRPGSDLFVDTGGGIDVDDNMIVWMGLRSVLPTSQVSRMRDWRHRRREFAVPPPEEWKRPDAVCHTRAAKEYYEIKPLSASGIPAADEKLKIFDEFLAGPQPSDPHHRPPWEKPLPYVRGTKYMTDKETRSAEIKIPPALQGALNVLLSMFNLTEIQLFVVWERPMPAMILYLIKIRIKTRDARPAKQEAMKDLARYALALAVQTATGAALVTPPKGTITVEVPPELDDFKEAIKASAGGMVFDCVPGETHLLVIEEPGFQRIIERVRQLPPLLRSVRAGRMFSSEEWQRALREDADARAKELLALAAFMLMTGMVIYVCWPVIGAAGAAGAAAGTGAGLITTDATVVSTGSGVLGSSGASVAANFFRAAAANDNAVALAKASAFALTATGYVFGEVKDAAAATRVLRTGVMMTSDAAFDPTWLLRNKFSLPVPAEFGEIVEVVQFGLLRVPGVDGPINQKFATQMRLITKVTFL